MSYTLTPLTAGPQFFSTPLATSSDGSVVLQAVQDDGIYVSTDSGASWTNPISDATKQWSDSTISANGQKMAVTTNSNDSLVSVSTDSGATWTPTTVGTGFIGAVAYTRDGTQLFASQNDKIYRSTNDGASWTEIASASNYINGLAVSDNGLTVLASLGGNGVYVGTFSGSWSWTGYLSGVFSYSYTCAISGDGTKMAIGVNSETLRYSTDSGVTWSQPTGAIGSATIRDVTISQDGSRFTAISYDTIYTTTNPASSWSSEALLGTNQYIAGSSTLSVIYTARQGNYILRGELQGPAPVICFREGSKILTFNPATGREEYMAVENIRPGTLVKTRMSGYVPVCMVGTSTVTIPEGRERTADRLYVCTKEQFPELTEDLYITGHHSILVNNMTDAEREECAEEMGRVYMTEGRCRLPAHISRQTRVYEAPGSIERIWHFALEHNDEQMNYGVYANGLLVESCSIWRLRTMVGYELMMGNVYTMSNTVSAPPARLPIAC
jgi:hypothetical protein